MLAIRDRQGEYTGRFILPDGRAAHGRVSLAANKPPSLSLSPDRSSEESLNGRGFPEDSVQEQLIGYLDTNDEVILGDVHLSEWFPDRFHASSRWGLIGLGATRAPAGMWKHLQVRLTGLECLLGNAIEAIWWPKGADTSPLRYSADLDASAQFTSSLADVSVTARYVPAFSGGDPYAFHVNNYATVEFVSSEPQLVDHWIHGWVDPLLALTTVATGEREEIDAILVSTPDTDAVGNDSSVELQISAQLFGKGIHQREQVAKRRVRSDGTPLVPLFLLSEAPPLATLIQTWKSTLADETATTLYRLALDPSLPPQVRYLLCAQAIEGLDSSSRAQSENSENERFASKRKRAVTALRSVTDERLDETTLRFVRDNLPRWPHRPLAGRLARLIEVIPDQEEYVASWAKMTSALGDHLSALGRPSGTLPDRLASTRNALSHGVSLPHSALRSGVSILEALLRGQLLTKLGFSADQLSTAYRRMTRAMD